MPVVVKSLEQVNETTEAATMNLMEAADKMTAFYSEFINDIEDFEDLVYKKDSKGLIKSIERIETDIDLAESLGFGILHALEFQDITEQKLMKVIKSVEEVGARIGGILGIIKARKSESDEIVEEASQDDIDSLLAEFGLG
jgi:chemotaxis regulatin CheY-phosphate phosphatase CheZ